MPDYVYKNILDLNPFDHADLKGLLRARRRCL